MDTDTIDRLEAGRELDALVAEKVMGWKHTKYHNGLTWDWEIHRRPITRYYPEGLPHFSTDIAAAWQVVAWMSQHDYGFKLEFEDFVWRCRFWPPCYLPCSVEAIVDSNNAHYH